MDLHNSLNSAVIFTNWTRKDFACKWAGVVYNFPARTSQTISIGTRDHNEALAQHFAKHLVDRELNERNVPTDHFSRAQYERNCFVALEESKPVPVMDVKIHQDTGLVQSVEKVGEEDPATGVVTKTDAEDVTADMPTPVEPTEKPIAEIIKDAEANEPEVATSENDTNEEFKD